VCVLFCAYKQYVGHERSISMKEARLEPESRSAPIFFSEVRGGCYVVTFYDAILTNFLSCYVIRKSAPFDPVLSQLNPIHVL
jgi:hypothetical protein